MQTYAVIGYPLEYTLSPKIHNYVFARLKVDAFYVPLRVPPSKLDQFIDVARDSLNGFNVTIPHKIEVVKRLDWTSREVAEIGSTNTVLVKDGKLHGYNTDYIAIRDALRERGYNGGDALLIGAGGVARAAVLALRDLNCNKLHVINRTKNRAVELCQLASKLGIECQVINDPNVKADLLINATPLGTKDTEISIDLLSIGVNIVLDLPYVLNGETALIRKAREIELVFVDGLEILIRQALAADEVWLGINIDLDWKEVRNALSRS